MSEMVERVARVARAMVESRPIPEGHIRGDVDWSFFRALARAAIAAMREPTEAMRKAAWNYIGVESTVWQTMIDEALIY